MADIHAHSWSAFSTLDSEGRNTRLMDICGEIYRCAKETHEAGGEDVIIAGDLFHVRGSVTPDVFNPVRDVMLRAAKDFTVKFSGIPGNHDLTSKESRKLGSSVAMLETQGIIEFHHEMVIGKGILMMPWQQDAAEIFRLALEWVKRIGSSPHKVDLIIHRGIDGTLSTMPPHGFTAVNLSALGFKRVFAGDYHHHKDFGGGVYSIGALTHQTWSDVGTKAGFLIVHDDRVDWRCSNAPQFIDISELGDLDVDDLSLEVEGHFVRARLGEATAGDITSWRNELLALGAKGVLINATPKTVTQARAGVTAKSLTALDKSVLDYVEEQKMPSEVAAICAEIMKEIVI